MGANTVDEPSPGVSFEFAPRDESTKAAFIEFALNAASQWPTVTRRNPHSKGGLRILSIEPLVWAGWFHSEEGLVHTHAPFADKGAHKTEEEWRAVAKFQRGIRRIARLRRVVVLGPVSYSTCVMLQKMAMRMGGLPMYPLIVVPAREPAWLSMLIHSGEVVACHSLAANWACMAHVSAGDNISYEVKDRLPMDELRLQPISGPFSYTVLAAFDGAGQLGRVLIVRPHHDPDAVYVCFRGAMQSVNSKNPNGDEIAKRDNAAVAQKQMTTAPWLHAIAVGRGVPSGTLRVQSGTLRYHQALYGDGSDGGLHAWMRAHLASGGGSSGGHARGGGGGGVGSGGRAGDGGEGCGGGGPQRILFVGFSFGGALAQITALRAAYDMPEHAPRMGVLGLGATQWASDGLSDVFEQAFGARAAQLVTAMAESPLDEVRSSWRIHRTVRDGGEDRGGAHTHAHAPADGDDHAARGGGDGDASAHDAPPTEGGDGLRPHAGGGSAFEIQACSVDVTMGEPSSALITAGDADGVLVDPLTLSTNSKTCALHNLRLLEATDRLASEAAAPTVVSLVEIQPLVEELREEDGDLRDEEGERALAVCSSPPPSLIDVSLLTEANPPMMQLPPELMPFTCVVHRPPTACVPPSVLKRKRELDDLRCHQARATCFYNRTLAPDDPFAVDSALLHRGEVYRKALVREHWRLRGLAHIGRELPLVMQIDTWEGADQQAGAPDDDGEVVASTEEAPPLLRLIVTQTVNSLSSRVTDITDDRVQTPMETSA